jgi:hypothetical protein
MMFFTFVYTHATLRARLTLHTALTCILCDEPSIFRWGRHFDESPQTFQDSSIHLVLDSQHST